MEDEKRLNKKRKRNESEDSYSDNNDGINIEGNENKTKKPRKNNKELILNSKNVQYFVKDSYSNGYSDNTFIIFNSLDNVLNITYSTEKNSIIFYNLNDNVKIAEIGKAHEEDITNFRHCQDTQNERDLILSASAKDNNLKIWNFNTLECIYNFEKVNEGGRLLSACFLNYKNNIYISTSNFDNEWVDNTELIKVFDFNGKIIKKINKSNEMTFFIDNFYDKKISKLYILTANKNYIKSYDYEENKLYHKYYDEGNEDIHLNILLSEKDNIIELIESCYDGYLRIWNFNSGDLLNKIKVNDQPIKGIVLWNDENILVGTAHNIKLIELKNEINISILIEDVADIITIKKINHSIYGECLLSQGIHFEQIKIWGIKNKN